MDIVELANGKFAIRKLTCRLLRKPLEEFLYVSSHFPENKYWVTNQESSFHSPRVQFTTFEAAQSVLEDMIKSDAYKQHVKEMCLKEEALARKIVSIHVVQSTVAPTLCERINALVERIIPWKRSTL